MQSFVGYIGTNAQGQDGGIRVVRADAITGALTVIHQVQNFDVPCYFSISRDRTLMVSARANPAAKAKFNGAVSTLRILPDGTLTPINMMPAVCAMPPCHSCISPDQRYSYSTHFIEGRATVYALGEDGSIWGPIQVIQYEGSGPHPMYQRSPHVHYACITPDDAYVLFVDLGLDVIHQYKPGEDGQLVHVADIPVETGAGCRHMVFSRDGKTCWAVSEIGCLVTAFAYEDGQFTKLETQPTMDAEQMVQKKAASAIRLSPDGKLLFIGNRFVDNIAVFRVQHDGRLERAANVPCVFPRDLNILPNGKFLYVCGQDNDRVEVFAVDADNASLTLTKEILRVPKATCIEFL